MGTLFPIGVTISRASAEAAWKQARREGREILAADLDLTWETQDTDTMTKAQRARIAGFARALRRMKEDATHDETTVAGAC